VGATPKETDAMTTETLRRIAARHRDATWDALYQHNHPSEMTAMATNEKDAMYLVDRWDGERWRADSHAASFAEAVHHVLACADLGAQARRRVVRATVLWESDEPVPPYCGNCGAEKELAGKLWCDRCSEFLYAKEAVAARPEASNG
jgi:hypothetical protein